MGLAQGLAKPSLHGPRDPNGFTGEAKDGRMLARTLAIAVLLAAPVSALTVIMPPQGIQTDYTASLATDQHAGTYTLYAPTTTATCRVAVASGSVPPNGVIGGLYFDRAGPWTLAVGQQESRVTVQPRPIQI